MKATSHVHTPENNVEISAANYWRSCNSHGIENSHAVNEYMRDNTHADPCLSHWERHGTICFHFMGKSNLPPLRFSGVWVQIRRRINQLLSGKLSAEAGQSKNCICAVFQKQTKEKYLTATHCSFRGRISQLTQCNRPQDWTHLTLFPAVWSLFYIAVSCDFSRFFLTFSVTFKWLGLQDKKHSI